MNINDVLLRVLKKNDQISEQILHRNEEEEVKNALEIKAREAPDREIEWEISTLERLKQVEVDRQTEDERWHSDELKKIEQETKARKLELQRLREAASELEKANRLKKAEEEEIAQLKRRLAVEEDNRRSNKIRARRNEMMSSRQEYEVDEDEDEEWEENVAVEEASEEEGERPVERSSKAKRNASGSPRRRLVESEDSTDDEDYLQPLRNSRQRTTRQKLSLPKEDLQSMRSAKTRMARRNLSSALLRVQETEDDYADEEDNYAPLPPRKRFKVKRKPQTSSGSLPRHVYDLMAQLQGFTPMVLASPHWSGSNSRSGSPMYMPGIHPNPYFPAYLNSFSPPAGFYGVGMPGMVINSDVGNVTNTTIPKYVKKTRISNYDQRFPQPVGHGKRVAQQVL